MDKNNQRVIRMKEGYIKYIYHGNSGVIWDLANRWYNL